LRGCSDCAKYEKQIKTLHEEIDLLKFELNKLRSDYFNRSREKPPKDKTTKTPLKKKGGLFEHIGWSRKKPKQIDRIEEVTLKVCPCCGSKDIHECAGVEEHIQEDIFLPRTETVLYRKRRYYCSSCRKTVTGHGENELAKSSIGPTAKAFSIFLKHDVKISERDIRMLFQKMFNMKITVSSITGFKGQFAEKASGIWENLRKELVRGSHIHADETGWRVNEETAWLWKFSNKETSITHIDKGRGQKVVENILGQSYDGVLISDYLSAYNKILAKGKQKCLVHILRDLKKVIEYWQGDEDVIRYCERLKKMFEGAIALHEKYKNCEWDKTYLAQSERIVSSLNDFAFPNPDKKILSRFAKRLERHKNEMFTFLYVRDIDYHNNHAEQQIRPNVILRKITNGSRSYDGAKIHSVCTSILQTVKLRGIDPLETLRQILLSPETTNANFPP